MHRDIKLFGFLALTSFTAPWIGQSHHFHFQGTYKQALLCRFWKWPMKNLTETTECGH